MIEKIKSPRTEKEVKELLHPIVREWFFSRFKEFSLPQLYAVKEVHNRNNILISAPTGGTKTLTAFLSILNELVTLSLDNKLEDRVYAIYISPLKSLNNDIAFNLQQPLKEIKELAKKYNKELNIRVAVRTGDTTTAEKAKMLKHPPHILITTPESLAIILSSYKFVEKLERIDWCVVDEIHALAENKRGVHLSLSLERLENFRSICRVGLSATVSPIEEIANFLVGDRDCKIAEITFEKSFDLEVISPVDDLINITQEKLHDALYTELDRLIQDHKTTLIFTNTRSGTERIVHHLKAKFPKSYTENIGAHHGSLSKTHRLEIENKLREGELKAVVCSTSLELGIDIGYIDLVICIGSPKSVARLLQRVGRAGHELHGKIKGRIVVMDRDDLVECSVLLKDAIEKKIDRIHIPKNCLDVLAQQIYGAAIANVWSVNQLYKMFKKSYCYLDLKESDFLEIIRYLNGEYSYLEDRHVYAKIWYEDGKIGKRGKLARMIYMTNLGTIPEETSVKVKIGEQVIGTIDESFLERLKRKDIFVLGGDTYQFLFSRGMTAQVSGSSGALPTVPSWASESLPLSFDLALDIGKFRRLMLEHLEKKSKKETLEFINSYLYVNKKAALAIYNYFNQQYLYSKTIPNDKNLILEHYSDEEKKYAIFHSLYGRRVNDVLARATAYALYRLQGRDVEVGISDNGFFLASKKNLQALNALKLLKHSELNEVMRRATQDSEILKRRFRHCATRALMILRVYKGKKKHVGRQQVSSGILMNAVRRISDDFSILKEARREVLEDLMDINNAIKIIKEINEEKIKVKEINNKIPTPFAFNLVLQGHLDVIRMEDRIEFLRRMNEMVLAKIGKNEDFR